MRKNTYHKIISLTKSLVLVFVKLFNPHSTITLSFLLMALGLSACQLGDNSIKGQIRHTLPSLSEDTSFAFSIDGGASFTSASSVNITLDIVDVTELIIAESLVACDASTQWQPYSGGLNYELNHLNDTNQLFVRYKLADGTISGCRGEAITHDNIPPPEVSPPTLTKTGFSLSEIPTIVFDEASGQDENGVARYEARVLREGSSLVVADWAPISSGETISGLTLDPARNYIVQIRAIDNAGNPGSIIETPPFGGSSVEHPIYVGWWNAQFFKNVDMDGDNDLDAIGGGYNNTGWYENLGDTRYRYHSISQSQSTRDQNIIDFDNDGDSDVAYILSSDGGKSIQMFRNINNKFSDLSVHTFANTINKLKAADIDADTDYDFIVIESIVDRLSVVENKGQNIFVATSIPTSLPGTKTFAVSDLDEDGYPDIVGFTNTEVYWLKGDAARSWPYAKLFDVTSTGSYYLIEVTDINNDGALDIVTGSTQSGNNSIHWHENNGSESFTPHAVETSGTETLMQMLIADIDEDGHKDIFLNDMTKWYKNTGSGVYSTQSLTNTVNFSGQWVDVADLDDDGDFDLHYSGLYGFTVQNNDGSETFTETRGNLILLQDLNETAVADLDGDLDLDIVVTENSLFSNAIYILVNEGAMGYILQPIPNAGRAGGVIAWDFDNDLDMDIIVSGGPDGTRWLENTGGLTFSNHLITTFVGDINVAKVNGDSHWDLVLGDSANDQIRYFQNNGNMTFSNLYSQAETAVYDVEVVDLDEDGDLDFLNVGWNATLSWFSNDGSQNFSETILYNDPSVGIINVTAADLDNDGDIDIIGGDSNEDVIEWHENNGSESFTRHTVAPFTDRAGHVMVADIDGDGYKDVLSTTNTNVLIYWNDASQNFTEKYVMRSAEYNYFTLHDMNGDGKLDLVETSNTDKTVSWYEIFK
ncbi:MAG: VCBS repeat-containing protein [Pseudobdellovibrionaceae bacterium]|nr:MAG: VCBS repeat-containing protein [Pseudobdellovibrionaceae bacterium]